MLVSLSCVCSCRVCGGCAAGRCAGSFRCLKLCCQGWCFSPDPRNFALVLGNSVRVCGILALALNILCSLFTWDFRTLHLAALVVWPFSSRLAVLRWLALRSFSCESHPVKCLRGVMFPVWVHGYAVRMWHPFVCGVCGVLRAAQVFRLG